MHSCGRSAGIRQRLLSMAACATGLHDAARLGLLLTTAKAGVDEMRATPIVMNAL